MSDRKANETEEILLALFDAHARVAEAKSGILQQYEDHEERGAVIEAINRAEQKIAETAVDRTQQKLRFALDQQRRRNDE